MSPTRHPAKAMVMAQTLRRPPLSLGVTATQRELAEAGFIVSYNTIRRWTEPAFADREGAAKLAAERKRRVSRSPLAVAQRVGPEWKLARMRVLKDAGLSYAAVAKVMGIDFPDDEPLTEHMVKQRLHTGEFTPGLRKRPTARPRTEIRARPRLTPAHTT